VTWLARSPISAAKLPGKAIVTRPVDLIFTYDEVFGTDRMEAYERLLSGSDRGPDSRVRPRGRCRASLVVAPVLENRGTVHLYEPGSWGPSEAGTLAEPDGGWHDPGEGL
jgi:glucose-6-phosphate 1-dehydrogenase